MGYSLGRDWPEVASAGDEQTVAKPKMALQGRLFELLDDKQHPFYEHRKAA